MSEEVHEWMFQTETHESNLDIILDLRDAIDELDPTTGTFRLQDVSDHHPTVFKPEFIWLVGSWQLPERIEPSRVNRYVNPKYVHRRAYADTIAECECGALVGMAGGEPWRRIDYHTDECKGEWRRKAAEKVKRERKNLIGKYGRMYLEASDAAPRTGMTPNAMTRWMFRNDVNWGEIRGKGRRRAVNTWRRLHDEYGHTYADIARAWDFSPSAVRSYVSNYANHFETV